MNMMHRLVTVTALVAFTGCSTGPGTKVAHQTEAHSFNVIKAVDGSGGFLLDGYSDYKSSASQALSPGAVLVVGVRDGVTLGSQRFECGAVVVVEGDERQRVFRKATEDDSLVVLRKVEVFGKTYPKGPFRVPSGGVLPSDSLSSSAPTGVPDGEYLGAIAKTIFCSGPHRLTLLGRVSHIGKPDAVRLELGEYPGITFVVSLEAATKVGLYRPKSETIEDAKGWKVQIRCQGPSSGSECTVLSIKRAAR